MSESSRLEDIRKNFLEDLQKLKNTSNLSLQLIEEARVKYLSRNSALSEVLKNLSKLSAEERPVIGKAATATQMRRAQIPYINAFCF